jgi:hypothetical protein
LITATDVLSSYESMRDAVTPEDRVRLADEIYQLAIALDKDILTPAAEKAFTPEQGANLCRLIYDLDDDTALKTVMKFICCDCAAFVILVPKSLQGMMPAQRILNDKMSALKNSNKYDFATLSKEVMDNHKKLL